MDSQSTAGAATIWTGPATNFTQSVASSASFDVVLPGVVHLTRGFNHWLYNPAAGDVYGQLGTPSDTEWAFAPSLNPTNATLGDVTGLSYQSFDSYRNGDLSSVLLFNKQMVMHLINEDIYIPVKFTAWPHGGGAFGYIRNTPTPIPAPTVWTGTPTNFAQSVASASSFDVVLSNAVHLTRGFNHWLYNPAGGDGYGQPGTPTDTEWAFAPGLNPATATLADVTNLSYQAFDSYRNGDLSGVLLPNKQMVMHLIAENIYVPVRFTAWPHGGGAFGYVRNTANALTANPTVSITSPTNGNTFTVPVTLTIAANATVSSGSVTNVTFLSNGTPLGSDQTAPFSISSGSLSAGTYAYVAVATANGLSTTSSVATVTVVNPTPSVSITNPLAGATFTAPANFQVDATASVAVGTITNVTFFANGTPIGSDPTAPFSANSGGLGAGLYGLTAVATAGGVSSTSAVVNISVQAPGAIILSSPRVSAGQFIFDYTATTGLKYAIENAVSIPAWQPITTNTASGSPEHFTNAFVPGAARYYRVIQVP
jgi:hypothetical protein